MALPTFQVGGVPIFQVGGVEFRRICMNEKFDHLTYYEQWDSIVQGVLWDGNWSALSQMMLHFIWDTFQIIVYYIICVNCGAGSSSSSLEMYSFEWWTIMMKNSIVFCYITATLAINGMYQGALLGFPWHYLSAYRFMPGTVKEPYFSIFGNHRTIFDVLLYIATLGVAIWNLITPNPTPLQAQAYLAVNYLQWATDYACWIGSDGMFHGALSIIYCSMHGGFKFLPFLKDETPNLAFASSIAAMQIWLGYLYFGCGIGKFGVWFPCCFAQEWTTPPWASGNKSLRNLFFKDAPNDYSNTRFAVRISYFASFCEWLPPFLCLLTDDYFHIGDAPTILGVLMIEAMHVYIIFHLPFANVTFLNILPGFLVYYAFIVYPGSKGKSIGYNFEDISNMNAILKVAMLCLGGYLVYGHFHTDKVTYTCALRFWAGNWPQGYYLVSKSALEKINDEDGARPKLQPLVVIGKVWVDELHPTIFPTQRDCTFQAYRALGQAWLSQLCARILPKLMEIAMQTGGTGEKKLSDYAYVMHCIGMNQFVGGVMGNCSLRSKFILERLQESCKFESGELLYVYVNSFPPMIIAGNYNKTTTWEIHDAKDGLLVQGETTHEECRKILRPSSCKDIELNVTLRRRRAKKDD